ncbi:hypothetical protein SDC9_06639 [bioreactor metagenome]|uniref:Uncharacterized protein n=1 Tax=bioreactor metagenome TaxID=1076179 RepID=A0A644T4I7_9ZZZZ|nr:hypothetical protein [Desulfovibrio desulfuricans]MDD3682713.1 hypothetical protein [Desulfovibrio desulfuricans]MEA4992163.1 hypothetical protein [Desulfovibrio desulfuricans]QTO40490.1 hypothetical protein J8J02_00725 [Desulfovibrio desulfuricans]
MTKFIEKFYSADRGKLIDDFLQKLHYGYQEAALQSERFHDARMRKQVLSLNQKSAGDLAFQQAFYAHTGQGSKWDPKSNRNQSYRYAYGIAGGLRFSINRLPHEGGKIRWANFRANHALTNQWSLFGDSGLDRPDFPYCLILHGPEKKHGEELGFARIVLPDPNLKMFIEMLELPVGAINTQPVQIETELPDAQPKAKPMEQQNIG